MKAVVRGSEVLKRNLNDLANIGRVPAAEDCFLWQDDYIVFPFHVPQGRSLLQCRQMKKEVTASMVLETVSDAFLLLSQVHERGVVHRNITPCRVHVQDEGRVSFSDFVVARIAGETTVADRAWELDPEHRFIAPECANDAHAATEKSDVFGLAASLVFWLTGIIPNADSDIAPHLASQGTPICELAELIAPPLNRCLVSRASERPRATEVFR